MRNHWHGRLSFIHPSFLLGIFTALTVTFLFDRGLRRIVCIAALPLAF